MLFPPYMLILDVNGQEERFLFRAEPRALAAWERAIKRHDVFAAQLYRCNPGHAGTLIADHQSEDGSERRSRLIAESTDIMERRHGRVR